MVMTAQHVRPDGIKYWINDKPPITLALMLAIQQIAFLGAIMTLPVVLGRAAGLDAAGEASLVQLTMITAGIGVVLQAWNRYGIGIGLFAPMHTSSAVFPAALAAVQVGGLGLAFGMMTVVGAVQMGISRIFPRIRAYFPVEIAGLTVFMLGSGLGLVGLKNFLGIDTAFQGNNDLFIVGFTTLAIIVGLNVWSKGHFHAFSVFIGLICGQVLAYFLDLVPHDPIDLIEHTGFFAVPSIGQFGWDFDWRLIPEFAIVGIALSFNSFGVLTIAQRANYADWKSPDVEGTSRGIMAEGVTNFLGSFVNSVTQTGSGGAVGLSQASGITSRYVAFVLGVLFIVLAFFPPIAMIWSVLSPAVIGAVLMFVGSFIAIGGLKILTSRLLDNRKTITLGFAVIAGVGADTLLVQVDSIPTFLDAAMATSLSVTVTVAVLLNALMRLGSKKKLSHRLELQENWSEELNRLIWHLGHSWGARPEVVAHLEHATNELIDTLNGHSLIEGKQHVDIAVRFDEYQCELKLSYQGQGFNLPDIRPSPESLIKNPQAVRDMAGYLIRCLADRVKLDVVVDTVNITLIFNE